MKSYRTNLTWWDRIMAAVTFAEANEAKTALEFANGPKHQTEKEVAHHCHGVNRGPKMTARTH